MTAEERFQKIDEDLLVQSHLVAASERETKPAWRQPKPRRTGTRKTWRNFAFRLWNFALLSHASWTCRSASSADDRAETPAVYETD